MPENITGAKELARIYWEKNIPVFLHGKPGVGKSDLWAQLAAEAKVGIIDLRLGMMDPVDLLGLPTVQGNLTNWSRPAYWPDEKRDGKRGILLFDELSDASRSMQSATYQIVLNRRAGPHILPPGWYPCAAGNRREDKAAAGALSTALANRFAHIDIVEDLDAFVLWANTKKISPYIIGFLRQFPKYLHQMEGADLRAFPSPRSWAEASKVCETSNSTRLRLMRGLVGDGVAGEFDAFMRVCDLPELEEIVRDPRKCRIPTQPASKYALSNMISQYATRDNFGKLCEYTKRQDFGRDFNICMVLDATKRDTALTETAAFITFANENTDLSL